MKLNVAGLHMDVGDSLQQHCSEVLESLEKHFPQIVDADVHFSKDQHKHCADIKVHSTQIHLRAEADGEDYFQAADHAMEKIVRQLKKYKGRLKKHRNRRDSGAISASAEIELIAHQLDEKALENTPEELEGHEDVVHKHVKKISPMSVDEAVMQMDLLHSNFYMFQNVRTKELNIVHRDVDGTIGWVEPSKTQLS